MLQLIERGYSLVADDVTRITSLEGRELIAHGAGNDALSHGSAWDRNHQCCLGLWYWRYPGGETARYGGDVKGLERNGGRRPHRLDRELYEILDIKVPHVTIPVRPGRDLARLIEVAAMDQKLKSLGSNAALEFNTKLLNLMEKKNPDGIA